MSLALSISQLLNSDTKAELNKQAKIELCGRCKLRQRRRTTITKILTTYCKECAVEVNRENYQRNKRKQNETTND